MKKKSVCILLLKKPLDKITINDLTTDCGISRMTFYYHFKDIYDLVEWCCLEDARIALQGKKTSSTWHEGLLQIFDAVIVLTYVTGESYYRGISEKAGLDKQEEKIYKYQYDMIVDSPDSQFWQAVYDSAKKKAAPNNVLIEIMGPDRETSYDKLDYMNMSIAAKADGIILQYNGEAGLEEAINTAVRNGIPVVTVMSDAVHSRRQSFWESAIISLAWLTGKLLPNTWMRTRRRS